MTRWLLGRATSGVVLTTWLAGLLGPVLLPHSAQFDVACSDEAFTAPHPRTQFEAALPPVTDEHCAVCHLQRVARGALAGLTGDVRGHEIDAARALAAVSVAQRQVTFDLPARAPPATLS
jgi:hypothetical protein